MSILEVKMFLPDMLRICAVMYFSSRFFKGVECTIVIKPDNFAAVSGEYITLQCATNVSTEKIAWAADTSDNIIYVNGEMDRDFSSYVSVSEKDGNSIMNISASLTAARKYFCMENSKPSASVEADLIVLDKQLNCSLQYGDDYTNATCSLRSAGNWNTFLKCEIANKGKIYKLQEVQYSKSDNKLVTGISLSTRKYRSDPKNCSKEVKLTEGIVNLIETNVPLRSFGQIGHLPEGFTRWYVVITVVLWICL